MLNNATGSICRVVTGYFILFLLSGCSPQFNSEGLGTLSALSRNRAEMDVYMRRQAEGYSRLIRDYEDSVLQKGLSKEGIISRYGDPVYCRVSEDGSGERCLYRQPAEYFPSSRIYLSFDGEDRLVLWGREGG